MYADGNPSTKAALKRWVAAGQRVSVFQPNDMFGVNDSLRPGQRVTLEGPHSPQPHRWYGQAVLGPDLCIDSIK